jgi:hypothetical protein
VVQTAPDVETADWLTFCLELLRRLDRIADELQKIADRLPEAQP